MPHFVATRSQYVVVLAGATFVMAVVATGVVVVPTGPAYHWNVASVPVAVADSLACVPSTMNASAGCTVMTGGWHTRTSAAVESTGTPQLPVTRTQ